MIKKIILLISSICAISTATFSQTAGNKKDSTKLSSSGTKQDTIKSLIRTANDLKSGNSLDVFNSFFQLAGSDLTGANKSFDFKSTILAMRLKSDSKLNIDTNYVKNAFDRNFQFEISLKLNQQYKFNGFSGGFNWAVINNRDSSLVKVVNIYDRKKFSDYTTEYFHDLVTYRKSITHYDSTSKERPFNTSSDKSTYSKLENYLNALQARGSMKINNDSVPHAFSELVNEDTAFMVNYQGALDALKKALQDSKSRGLVTFSMNGIVDSSGKVNSGNAGLIWLKGFNKEKANIELDARCNLSVKDTSISDISKYRSLLTGTLGVNFTLSRNSNSSVLELKPYLEYDRVLGGFIGQEKQKPDKYLMDADLRIRITQNLWLPLTIKYDVSKGNFLGFLNVSINMNAFNSNSSSKKT